MGLQSYLLLSINQHAGVVNLGSLGVGRRCRLALETIRPGLLATINVLDSGRSVPGTSDPTSHQCVCPDRGSWKPARGMVTSAGPVEAGKSAWQGERSACDSPMPVWAGKRWGCRPDGSVPAHRDGAERVSGKRSRPTRDGVRRVIIPKSKESL